jgi:hypothetical protein
MLPRITPSPVGNIRGLLSRLPTSVLYDEQSSNFLATTFLMRIHAMAAADKSPSY